MIAVTGATGALGGRVAARLAGQGVDLRLVVSGTVLRLTRHPPLTIEDLFGGTG